jgi:hypothetical protein
MVVKVVELDEEDETAKCCLDYHWDEQTWFPASVLSLASVMLLFFYHCYLFVSNCF